MDQNQAIKTGYWLKNGCLIVDNHKLPVFSVAGAFFSLGTFFGSNVPICLSSKPQQTRCFPDGCHESVFLATV